MMMVRKVLRRVGSLAGNLMPREDWEALPDTAR